MEFLLEAETMGKEVPNISRKVVYHAYIFRF